MVIQLFANKCSTFLSKKNSKIRLIKDDLLIINRLFFRIFVCRKFNQYQNVIPEIATFIEFTFEIN